jgi:Spy/CpxP family protein refolding chaperone
MKSNWKQLLLVFCAGIMIGSFLIVLKYGHSWHRGPHGQHHRERMMHKLQRELGLTAEQEAKVSAIMTASHEEMEKVWCELKPRFETIRSSTTARIKEVLTPEQQTKFAAIDAKMQERKHKWRSRKNRFGCDDKEKTGPPS